ncbi:hypothetical protein B0T24DRAFT_77142 [Lasiosphaeria ovina]|uniref:Uncharacterized protein n=1 Tax=Lasiosphaeria ovina TaxID=92902 RepID=A0AAE0TYN1_9PEZI|nr:hypothetical protein B0T24DRAFT_77142 [Lasiosphaeria ovina]
MRALGGVRAWRRGTGGRNTYRASCRRGGLVGSLAEGAVAEAITREFGKLGREYVSVDIWTWGLLFSREGVSRGARWGAVCGWSKAVSSPTRHQPAIGLWGLTGQFAYRRSPLAWVRVLIFVSVAQAMSDGGIGEHDGVGVMAMAMASNLLA